MKRIFQKIFNIGIYEGMPVYEYHRVRFINFLQIVSMCIYIVYAIFGMAIYEPIFIYLPMGMIAAGLVGLWLNERQQYKAARTFFLAPVSLLILIASNCTNVGPYFIVFYFPVFVAYILFYDIRNDLGNALFNLTITTVSALCAVLLPHNLILNVEVESHWIPLIRNVNYILALAITLSYIFFIISHINRTGTKLVNLWRETERQKWELAEAKMRAESAAEARSRFLSNMSHELRTPLNGIVGTVQLLLQERHLPEQETHYRVLKFSSEHMLSLINDILDFSKIEAGKMELYRETFNLKASLDKLHGALGKEFANKGLSFELKADRLLDREFTGDEGKLTQVLQHLLGNALKFTQRGSVVLQATLVAGSSDEAEVLFSIRDTGIGMSPEKQALVFEAFEQGETSSKRTYGGVGLGLSLSRRLVDIQGGELKVKSEPGKGSEFYFTLKLPVSRKETTFLNEKKVSGLEPLKGLRILVAEDSSVNMMITRKFLMRWDVEVHEATNGQEALDAFHRMSFDVLLIDLDMPIMDGYEALGRIREENPDVPAIAFTAAVLPNMKDYLKSKGFNDFLQKPFRPEDLHRKIAQHYRAAEGSTVNH